jgi:hypothetical protein
MPDGCRLQVSYGSVFSWVAEWERNIDMSSAPCQALVARYEEELRTYGYSLKNLSWVGTPTALHDIMLDTEIIRRLHED